MTTTVVMKKARCAMRSNSRGSAARRARSASSSSASNATCASSSATSVRHKGAQRLAAGRRLERAVVHDADELGGDEHAHAQLESCEVAQSPKDPIAPVAVSQRYRIAIHEGTQQRGVPLLLTDQQSHDRHDLGHGLRAGELGRAREQVCALALLAELKHGDRAGDRDPLGARELIGALV